MTSRHLIPALFLAMLAATAGAQTTPAPETPEAPPEQILVVGQKPGPGLWKVSKDDHVLYVFGTYGPLPRKMEWRSREVEGIIAQSQEFLGQPGTSFNPGVIGTITMLPFMIGLKKSPDGKVLRDLVPASTHERWLVLRKKYLDDDDDYERERPLFVANALQAKAMAAAGLSNGKDLREQLQGLAKKGKLKITPTTLALSVDSPGKAVRDFKKAPLDDIACFTGMIERLETDVDILRARANAWAIGDIAAMRALDYSESPCWTALQNSAVLKERGLDDLQQRARNAWLAAAERSLAANKSTFAVLPMSRIFGKENYLAALEAKGYRVEQPE